MENATKALLIAGSVLIAIVLIAVGIKILSSTSGITDEVDGLSTTMEASIFNSQFTQYAGRQSATEVRALISLIASTYRAGNEHTVKLQIKKITGNGFTSNYTYSTADSISDKMSLLQSNYTYTVSITQYEQGYVKVVTIQ